MKLKSLFDNNRAWAKGIQADDPSFFTRLAALQNPEYLWIGCSDSRVPANQIIGVLPGQIFVHRNLANVVVHSDLNCLSVIQFAVDVLAVKHIIVCGHYGCGGVHAALHNGKMGLADNWLRHIQDTKHAYAALFEQAEEARRWDLLCELNVISQVVNVAQTTVIRDAWERGQELAVHGWIYALSDGLLRDLSMSVERHEALAPQLEHALRRIEAGTERN
ncbi:MAG: carbonate dehydratase [Alphaproteobacteria bacterium]|nr:carbonate dehydratase [Alphaproteobacteria bacterium]